jgi:hypothetical protein
MRFVASWVYLYNVRDMGHCSSESSLLFCFVHVSEKPGNSRDLGHRDRVTWHWFNHCSALVRDFAHCGQSRDSSLISCSVDQLEWNTRANYCRAKASLGMWQLLISSSNSLRVMEVNVLLRHHILRRWRVQQLSPRTLDKQEADYQRTMFRKRTGMSNVESLTYLLTELSPSWGAAKFAAPQELPNILWNPKVQYRVHKRPPLAPIVSHINPIHSIPSYLSKIRSNIVRPPTSWSFEWSLSFWLSH